MHKISIPLIVALLMTGAAAAWAAADVPGRYTLTPNGSGFVRLDTQTGQVSECTGAPSSLICKSTPDERAALQSEIDRLTVENDKLRALGPANDVQPQLSIPSDKDVDRAFGFLERMIKRFKGLIEEMRKEPTESMPL
jgi:hypothetical protein